MLLTGLIYAPVVSYGFLRWDDSQYVTHNELVRGGLSVRGMQSAFADYQCSNYHPLTMLSLMLDATLFSGWAGGFHLTNVVLHLSNVCLLYGLLRRLTGNHVASFWVALLFAIHPTHVESVAWISGRKDVLSLFFGLLAIRSYVRYAERSQWSAYILLFVFHGFSLLSKPTLVTLPCVLLLLDAWPLRRGRVLVHQPQGGPSTATDARSWGFLFLEKCPLFLLSGLLSFVVAHAQQEAMVQHTWVVRFGNAISSYGLYLRHIFLPFGLSPYYSHPGQHLSGASVAVSAAIIIATSILAFIVYKRIPAVAVGWLWFLGTLVPVNGLVAQVGGQGMADRYAYFSAMGVFIALAWVAIEYRDFLSLTLRRFVAIALVLVLVAFSSRQVNYWKTDRSLWTRALKLHPANPMAHLNLGAEDARDGNSLAAEAHFEEAIRIWPTFGPALHRLAVIRMDQDRNAEARMLIERAIQQEALPVSRVVRGLILAKEGQLDSAITEYQQALKQAPELVLAHFELGMAYETQGQIQGAIEHFEHTVRLSPKHPSAHTHLEKLRRQIQQPSGIHTCNNGS